MGTTEAIRCDEPKDAEPLGDGPVGDRSAVVDLDRVSREIESTVDEVAGFLNAQHARLVDQVVSLLADVRLWQGEGLWTMRAWLGWRAGVSPATAGHLVAIAERAGELPCCMGRFRRGELSVDQMAAVAARAPSWTDAQTAELASGMTVTQLRRLLATYPFPADPDADGDPGAGEEAGVAGGEDDRVGASGEPGSIDTADETVIGDGSTDGSGDSGVPGADAGEAAEGGAPGGSWVDEWCSSWWDDNGRLRLSAQADADAGGVVQAALLEARDHLQRSTGGEVTMLDALREMAERSLDAVADPGRRQRFKVSVFIDTDDTTTAAGQPVTPGVQRHLTCDGELVPVMVENGIPLSVGRRQRIVPDRTRRVVEHRDGYRCGVPGCEARHWLEVHHIVHWLDGGPTDTWNLICLCPHHHRLHHRGRLGIVGNADVPGDVVFTDAKDRPITGSGARPIPPSGPPPPLAGRYVHPFGERFDTRWFEFSERHRHGQSDVA